MSAPRFIIISCAKTASDAHDHGMTTLRLKIPIRRFRAFGLSCGQFEKQQCASAKLKLSGIFGLCLRVVTQIDQLVATPSSTTRGEAAHRAVERQVSSAIDRLFKAWHFCALICLSVAAWRVVGRLGQITTGTSAIIISMRRGHICTTIPFMMLVRARAGFS